MTAAVAVADAFTPHLATKSSEAPWFSSNVFTYD